MTYSPLTDILWGALCIIAGAFWALIFPEEDGTISVLLFISSGIMFTHALRAYIKRRKEAKGA